LITEDNFLENIQGSDSWTQDTTAASAAQVTCGKNGQMAIVTTDGQMHVKNLVSYADPMGLNRGWHTDSSMTFSQVTIGEGGQMYALSGGKVFFRQGRTDTDAVGTSWEEFPPTEQSFKHIDAGNFELWGVNVFNEVYRRHGSEGESQIDGTGYEWQQYTGTMIFAQSAEEGVVWALDDEHDVWVLRAGTITSGEIINNEPTWTKIPDVKLVYVDVGKEGQLVGLANTGCPFWKKGITDQNPEGVNEWWDLTNDQSNQDTYYKFGTIAMCMTGNMHATLKEGDSALYFRAGVSKEYPYGVEWVRSSVDAGETLKQVSCGYRGYVWAVTTSGNVLKLEGVTADQPQGTSWSNDERSSISHISIGDAGEIWANDYNGNVFYVGDNNNQGWQ